MLRTALAIMSLCGGISVAGSVTPAGYAPRSVSGYAVSDIAYDDTGDPGRVHAVRLKLDAAATDVNVRLTRGSAWASCSPTGLSTWRCPLSEPIAVADITRLEVLASG